ncbi:type II and III secretion system protein family protein [Desulfobacter sp.]|uniref:type II and III secretion system protein family protein n=1 Tax=Desulfobacter sp. TaxID=2294 RepID=UPI003D0E20D3
MRFKRLIGKLFLLVAVTFIFVFRAVPAWSGVVQTQVVEQTQRPLELVVGTLGKIQSTTSVARVHIADPEVAEIIYSENQSSKWVFCSAKAPGTTQLTLWDEKNTIVGIYNISVVPDLTPLKKNLHDIFPNENIRVFSTNNSITLTGTVSGATTISRVLELAESYLESSGQGNTQTVVMGDASGQLASSGQGNTGKVINLLQVGGIQQVMLEVRIAEMSRSLGEEMGVNFNWMTDNTIGLSLLDQITALPEKGYPENPMVVSSSVNAIFSYFSGSKMWTLLIDAMKEEGLIQILAKPTLISLSGQPAHFLAGGEFPVPVPDDDGIGVEWREFGVRLNFTPTVLDDGIISMNVSPEVSELDYTSVMTISGYVIPGLTTRKASTRVELKDGQSFAIAGLLNNKVRETIHKFPLLGDIPILGALFRSSSFQKDETELVIVVTPHLVKPFYAESQSLPTDSFVPPDSFEFNMLGLMEGRGRADDKAAVPQPHKKGLEGDFGYIIPE